MSLEALGLPPTATEADVKARYKELARLAHPDAGGSAEAFQELQNWRDKALEELSVGVHFANYESAFATLRAASRGARCPRCDGDGYIQDGVVGFRPRRKKCTMCFGKGRLP